MIRSSCAIAAVATGDQKKLSKVKRPFVELPRPPTCNKRREIASDKMETPASKHANLRLGGRALATHSGPESIRIHGLLTPIRHKPHTALLYKRAEMIIVPPPKTKFGRSQARFRRILDQMRPYPGQC